MVFDASLRFVFVTGRSPLIDGADSATLSGRALADVVPVSTLERFSLHHRAALQGQETSFEQRSIDGGQLVEVRSAPLEEDGKVIGAVMVLQDITERHGIGSPTSDEEHLFREMAEQSSDVISSSDGQAVYRYVSPSCARIYGWHPEQMIGRPVHEFMHPDEHARHEAARAALTAGASEQVTVTRCSRPDGGWIWVESRLRALRDAEGRICGVQSSARDISDRKAAEAERRVADTRFRTAFDDAPIGMALVAPDGSWLRVNDALCSIVGHSRDELLTKTFQDITHADDVDTDVGLVEETLAGHRTGYRMDKRYLRADGTIVWVSLSVSLVRDDAGQPLHFISQLQNISDTKRLENELRELATRDDLTGLHNRRYFEHQFAQELQRIRRHGGCAAVLLFDLDGFKGVNDSLGHHAGDQVLKHVADVLLGRLRSSDTVARLGGDEFAVLMPHASVKCATHVARSLEAKLKDCPAAIDDQIVRVQASIGTAALDPVVGAEATLRACDHAMYERKRSRT